MRTLPLFILLLTLIGCQTNASKPHLHVFEDGTTAEVHWHDSWGGHPSVTMVKVGDDIHMFSGGTWVGELAGPAAIAYGVHEDAWSDEINTSVSDDSTNIDGPAWINLGDNPTSP